jgi:diguanylate cyclase (GGDEF)-like protein
MKIGRRLNSRDLPVATRRTLGLALVMAFVGCALSAVVLRAPAPYAHPVITWWELAPAIALARALGPNLEVRGQAHTFSLTELPLLVGCLFAPPGAVIVACMLGEAVGQVGRRRQAGLKLAFNMAQFLLETVVMLLLVQHFVGHEALASWEHWLGVLGVAAPASALGAAAISCATYWHGGRLRTAPAALAWAITVVLDVNLALLSGLLLLADPGALALLASVLVLTALAFRGFANLSKRYASLQMLYDFTKELGASLTGEAVLGHMLCKARDLLAAELAEVVLFDRDSGRPILSQRSSGSDQGIVEPLFPESEGPPWARLALGGRAVCVRRSAQSSALAAVRDELGVRDMMVAPLRGDHNVTGAILVANRVGNLRAFDDDDCRLFETLANHASVAFENSRLVQQLRREAEERRYEALHDALTGLPNRAQFTQLVDNLAVTGRRCAVLLMDLDRFKEVNDTLGHHNGDALLCKVAARLRGALPPGATPARLGGDEFAVLLPEATDIVAAELAARAVLKALQDPLVVDDLVLDVGASIGIALAPEHGTDSSLLLQRADVAMYEAKAARSGSVAYQSDRDVYSPRRLALTGGLRQAIESGDILVYFQPQARVTDGRVLGAEALVRWRHHELGLLGP